MLFDLSRMFWLLAFLYLVDSVVITDVNDKTMKVGMH